jgi:uncharacterized paraquat-inducible protein A
VKLDLPRIGLFVAGVAAGAATFALVPSLGTRSEAFTGTVVTVFSILAGIQLAIFALLAGLRPAKFRKGTSRAAAKSSTRSRWVRQLFLFYVYFAIMSIIVINQAFDFGGFSSAIERTYVALSVAALVWSLGLPVALSAIQDDSNVE